MRRMVPILFCLAVVVAVVSIHTSMYFISEVPATPGQLYDSLVRPSSHHAIDLDSIKFNSVLTTNNILQRTQECTKQFADYAKSHAEMYKNVKHIDDVLTIGYMKRYISVVIVGKNSKFNEKEANQFAEEIVLHGPNKVQEKLDLKNLFKPFPAVDKKITFVLVSGAPGIGKSTLAMEIARNWQTLTDFSLAYLIKLREKRFQHSDLDIESFYNSLDIPQNIRKCIAETNGKGILWILDGFDELPLGEAQTSRSSFYHRMIQKQFHDISQSSIIVTSRPSASTSLSPYLDDETTKNVEIVGFNKIQIEEFAIQQFKNRTNLLSNFTDYYTQNPLIEALMYVPLNAAIITFVFQKEVEYDKSPPHSLTELYNSLVCTLLQRQKLKLNQNNPILSPVCKLMTAEDIDNLPSIVRSTFLSLTSLAYHGTLRQNYIFHEVEDDLGLMSKVASLYSNPVNPVYSYNFFHMTLQEYLAAIHVAQNSSLVDSMKHHEVVVMFIFGIFSRSKYPDNIALSQVFNQQNCQLRHLYEYPHFKHVEQPYQVFYFDTVLCELPSDYYIAGHLVANFNVSIHSVSFTDDLQENFFDKKFKSRIDKFVSGLNSKPYKGAVTPFGQGTIQVLSFVYYCSTLTLMTHLEYLYYDATLALMHDDSYNYKRQTLHLYFKTNTLDSLKITSSKENVSFTCGRFKGFLNRKQHYAWFKNLRISVHGGIGIERQITLEPPYKRQLFFLEGEFDYLHISSIGLSCAEPLQFNARVLFEIFKSRSSDRLLKIDTLSLENFDFRNLSSNIHHLINANHRTVSNQLIVHDFQPADLDIFFKKFVSNHHELKQLRITHSRLNKASFKEEIIYNLLQYSPIIHLTIFLSDSLHFTNFLLTKKLSSLRIWWSSFEYIGLINVSLINYKFFQIINSNSFFVNQLDIILADRDHLQQARMVREDDIKALSHMIMKYTGKSPLALHLIANSFPIDGVIALINATLLNYTSHRISILVCYHLYSQLPFQYLNYTRQSDILYEDECRPLTAMHHQMNDYDMQFNFCS